jgi:hypothetical protein
MAAARIRGRGKDGRDEGGEKPLALIIVKRSSIFLFVMFFLASFYWVVGSFRSFLEETQLMLLGLLRWASMGLSAVAALGMVLSLAYLAYRRRAGTLAALLGYAILVACGAAGLVLSHGLVALSRGLG